MPWILLDGRGRRFMNEYEPYVQDTGHRPLERFVPEAQDFARLPAWLVADEDGRKLTPFGRPTYNDAEQSFEWSEDNLAEVDSEAGRRRASARKGDVSFGAGALPLARPVEPSV